MKDRKAPLKIFDKNTSNSNPRKIRESILSPDPKALEQLLIIKFAPDATKKRDGATDYATVKKLASSTRGYTVINSNEIILNNDDDTVFLKSHKTPIRSKDEIKLIISPSHYHSKKDITIWIEGHSAPGWVFSAIPNHEHENSAALRLRNKIIEIENATGKKVKNAIINSCNSATEIIYEISEDKKSYINSSARLLSILLPDKQILGFIGYNSTSTTKISKKTGDGSIEQVILPIAEASVVFKNGEAIEYSTLENTIINGNALKPFLLKSCEIIPDSTILHFLSARPKKHNLAQYKNHYYFVNDTLYYVNNKNKDIEIPLIDLNLLTSLFSVKNALHNHLPQQVSLLANDIMTCILANTTNTEHYPSAQSQQFSVCPVRETFSPSISHNGLQHCYAVEQYDSFMNLQNELAQGNNILKEDEPEHENILRK